MFAQALPEPDDDPGTVSLSLEDTDLLLLPDLRTLPPYDLEIERLADGSRELRLSNTIWNSGAGALELEGELNASAVTTRVVQHIDTRFDIQLDHLVGEFIWHPTHDHWHFEDFSIYELWQLGANGGLEAVVSSSDKISYCVIDTDRVDPEHKAFTPERRYYGCGRRLQGLSAGWGDTYKSHLDGQSIHLAGVQDGFYALKSTTNPDRILLESDYDNNAAIIYLKVRGNEVEVVDPVEYLDGLCRDGEVGGVKCRK